MSTKIKFLKDIWTNYGDRLLLVIGLILIATVSFQAGYLNGQKLKKEPLIIEIPQKDINYRITDENGLVSQNIVPENKELLSIDNNTNKCLFIGSKNSDKYHYPSCQWAKRIKPENIVCFKSEEEAKSKGYVLAGCCNK